MRVLTILDGKARRVAAAMRRAATVADFPSDTRKPVGTCDDYLLKYAPYLHYDRYLAAGYPIATGVIEGACRYLVRDRMELTGARWRLVGAEAVLKLRALRANRDFDAYWDFHEAREYQRNYCGNAESPMTTGGICGCRERSVTRLVTRNRSEPQWNASETTTDGRPLASVSLAGRPAPPGRSNANR